MSDTQDLARTTTPINAQFDTATKELITALLESLPRRADPGRFWDGHAVATLYSAAAASTSPASMRKHATAALRVEHIDSEIFARAERALTVIDRDYPAWTRYIERNLADIVARRTRPPRRLAPEGIRRASKGRCRDGPACGRRRHRRNCTRFARSPLAPTVSCRVTRTINEQEKTDARPTDLPR